MSDIGGAYLLLDQGALYETPPYVRTWRMRGRGGTAPSTATGEAAYDADTLTGTGTAPTTPPGAVTNQTVALAGGVT